VVIELSSLSQYNTWCYFTSKLKQIEKIDLSENEAIIFVNYGNYCEPMNTRFEGTNIYGIEILTSKKEKAKHIVDVLASCHAVVNGYVEERTEEIIRRFDRDPIDVFSQVGRKGVVYGDDALLFACKLLQKVYDTQTYENSVCKYYVAKEIYALHPMELHPCEDPFIKDYLLTDRIRIANVVVDCYSVLEELHLQIKANTDNPSVINNEWNPVVKEELYSRLLRKNINPNETIPWLTRNGFIRPFKDKVIQTEKLCEWSDGEVICDFEINICEAILELSYIRSHLSSHNINENVLKLSVYDAENEFTLARIILLNYFEIGIMIDTEKNN